MNLAKNGPLASGARNKAETLAKERVLNFYLNEAQLNGN